MASRKDEFKSQGSSNPATAFLEWKSEKGCFQFYDKEKGQTVDVPLPLNLVILKQLNTVKGYHEKSNSGIYSNEVVSLAKDPLTVKAFKGGTIASGMWNDIKSKVDAEGGRFNKSIYAMTEKGKLINLSLQGATVSAWFDFEQENRSRLADEMLSIFGIKSEKKGRVEYSVPEFKILRSLSATEGVQADELYAKVIKYLNNSGEKSERENDVLGVEESSEETIPF